MPQFELKHYHEEDWIEVSETAFLQSLLDNFSRITPIISEMLQGREIVASNAIFRIKNDVMKVGNFCVRSSADTKTTFE